MNRTCRGSLPTCAHDVVAIDVLRRGMQKSRFKNVGDLPGLSEALVRRTRSTPTFLEFPPLRPGNVVARRHQGNRIMPFEPWMVRTAAVIAAFFLVDVVLYLVGVRIERRRSTRSLGTIQPRYAEGQQHSAAA